MRRKSSLWMILKQVTICQDEERRNVPKKQRFDRQMTRDLKYLCRRSKLDLPCLPIHGKDESKLFVHLVLHRGGRFDEEKMALDWIQHCNGTTIFPKLPVYLRWHYKKWKRNQKTREAVMKVSFCESIEFIKRVNSESSKTVATPTVDHPVALTDC